MRSPVNCGTIRPDKSNWEYGGAGNIVQLGNQNVSVTRCLCGVRESFTGRTPAGVARGTGVVPAGGGGPGHTPTRRA